MLCSVVFKRSLGSGSYTPYFMAIDDGIFSYPGFGVIWTPAGFEPKRAWCKAAIGKRQGFEDQWASLTVVLAQATPPT